MAVPHIHILLNVEHQAKSKVWPCQRRRPVAVKKVLQVHGVIENEAVSIAGCVDWIKLPGKHKYTHHEIEGTEMQGTVLNFFKNKGHKYSNF